MTSPVFERLKAISVAISDARAALDEGNAVDLSGLENAVQEVCEDIAAAASQDHPEKIEDGVEQAIHAVLADLDQLSAVLSRSHQRLVAGEGLNNAALNAYGAKGDSGGDGGGTNGDAG